VLSASLGPWLTGGLVTKAPHAADSHVVGTKLSSSPALKVVPEAPAWEAPAHGRGARLRFDPPVSASNLPEVSREAFFGYSKLSHQARRYSNNGPAVLLLEERLAAFHEVGYCIAVASGFWALVLAAKALALPGRDRVVMPSLTYRRMADAMALAGLVPRFCEVDPLSLAATPATVAPLLDDSVGLVLAAHPMVGCCDAWGLERLAANSGVPVLFDSVESPYERLGGRRTGSFGNAEVFSMHASKLLSAMEGGYITTNDPELARRLRLMRAFGFNGPANVEMLGANAKLNEVHAAFGLACLDGLSQQVPLHKARYEAYQNALSDVPGWRLLAYDAAERPSYRQVVAELGGPWPLTREQTLAALAERGVLARAYYFPALHQRPAAYPCEAAALPVTDDLAGRFVLLPSGSRFGLDDVGRLAQLLLALYDDPLTPPPPPALALPKAHSSPSAHSASGPGGWPGATAALARQGRSSPASRSVGHAGRRKLALLGGTPAFSQPLPVGQLYYPSFAEYQRLMGRLFDSGWYTNHGPLAQEAEARLAGFFGTRHAVVMANATIGLMALAVALDLKGPVAVPAFTFPATAQAFTWAGCEVTFCDVEATTHMVSARTLGQCLASTSGSARPEALVAVNLWGSACATAELAGACEQAGVKLVFDSAQAAGTSLAGRKVGGNGLAEVFSFHATKILSSAEGGCVATNDDELADRLRNVRSSYGAPRHVAVRGTLNGRFSEAQAALVLHSLEDFERRVDRNRSVLATYRSLLSQVPGLELYEPAPTVVANASYAVVSVDEEAFGLGRDALVKVLRAENVLARDYFAPGLHKVPPYAGTRCARLATTEQLCKRLLQLPVGAQAGPEEAAIVAEVCWNAHEQAAALAGELGERSRQCVRA